MSAGSPATPRSGLVRLRKATEADLAACGTVWRDSINDYLRPLHLPEFPQEFGAIRRLHGHTLETDPELFWVAVRSGDDAAAGAVSAGASADAAAPTIAQVVGFTSAVRRDQVWYLSMLFVLPRDQGLGIGRALLDRVLPAGDSVTIGTGTDSAQPISNALYASLGMVPRMPLYSLVGNPRPDAFPPLPGGVAAEPIDPLDPAGALAIDAVEREIAFSHPQDRRLLQLENRRGFLYRDGGGRPIAFGYTSAVGRVGPIGVRDTDLLPAVLGHLTSVVQPRGAFAMWVPGDADRAFVPLLRAGFRLEGFPVLLCWSRPLADFSRYIPISPGLL